MMPVFKKMRPPGGLPHLKILLLCMSINEEIVLHPCDDSHACHFGRLSTSQNGLAALTRAEF
ncbi:hypothetical protein M413DRAFT_442380 [Hebeloma cylindrosporum]|uniref:Uncharacterized protein n=1 Tax=Hebeloma cylindrosporum TaxID=76867 RepID=A0A0C3CJW5_HEBCY|nr:hypothetical protein M413DRAFT_442380 [Hebeloma cylindrosporum h7]